MSDKTHEFQLGSRPLKKKPIVGFTKLTDLEPKERTNVCGVVVFRGPIKPTKTNAFHVFFRLIDPSHPLINNAIRCNMFFSVSKHEQIEAIKPHRTIIVARNVKIQEFNQDIQIVLHDDNGTLLFDANQPTPLMPQFGMEALEDELILVNYIQEWWRELANETQLNGECGSTNQVATSSRSTSYGARPTVTYDKAHRHMPYINFTGQLLNYNAIHSGLIVLYLTDYTEQLDIKPTPNISTDKDIRPVELRHEGCIIQREAIIECCIWDEHAATFVQSDPRLFDYVRLENVSLKIDNIHGRLVGNVRGGSYGRVTVPLELSDIRVETIRKRKQSYLNLKDESLESVVGKNSTRQSSQTVDASLNKPSVLATDLVLPRRLDLSSIPKVLDSHQVPWQFKIQARLVSYFPKDLRDFCIAVCSKCGAKYRIF
ncbi:hypothetical protein BDF19DRAFT_99174 [Syncephalis fuscata]|nr:hypothetical protein BDF19DRAFT_99174 [Syncephalis fuscata]